MSKLEKIKTMLSSLLELEMASATSDKGVIYYDGEELAEGVQVYVEDEEGNRTPAEDGTYVVDVKIVEIKDGKIVSIEDKQEETEVEESERNPISSEEVVEAEEEVVETEEVENPTNEGEETDTEGIVELRKEVNELYAIVDALRKEIEELKAKPVAMSAVEEIESIVKEEKNLKGAARYSQYLKK